MKPKSGSLKKNQQKKKPLAKATQRERREGE